MHAFSEKVVRKHWEFMHFLKRLFKKPGKFMHFLRPPQPREFDPGTQPAHPEPPRKLKSIGIHVVSESPTSSTVGFRIVSEPPKTLFFCCCFECVLGCFLVRFELCLVCFGLFFDFVSIEKPPKPIKPNKKQLKGT